MDMFHEIPKWVFITTHFADAYNIPHTVVYWDQILDNDYASTLPLHKLLFMIYMNICIDVATADITIQLITGSPDSQSLVELTCSYLFLVSLFSFIHPSCDASLRWGHQHKGRHLFHSSHIVCAHWCENDPHGVIPLLIVSCAAKTSEI